MADRADKIREEAREKERRIDAALTAIEALKPDEAAFVYARLEKRILADSTPSEEKQHPSSGTSGKKSAKTAKTGPAKKSASEKKPNKSSSLSSRIEQLLQSHPRRCARHAERPRRAVCSARLEPAALATA